MKKFGNMLWGLVFIAIGIIIAINSLGIADIDIFFDGWWTLFIIIPSLIALIKNSNKTMNIIFIIIGVLLLLCAQGVISFWIIRRLFLPIVLVIIGVSFILRDTIHSSINNKIKEFNTDGLESFTATFGEQRLDINGQDFKGANLNSIFGSIDYDIRDVIIEKDEIINCSAIFGGIDIIVPDNVMIKVKATPIFGGVDNKMSQTKGEKAHTIYVNAFCMFGGVSIK